MKPNSSPARTLRRLILAAIITAASYATVAEALPTWAQSLGVASGQTTSVETLYDFTGQRDGGNPIAALAQGADGALYGTTQTGGAIDGGRPGAGTVFRITSAGAFSSLYAFPITSAGDEPEGADPLAPLLEDANGVLYGTTLQGGVGTGVLGAEGTIFRITAGGNITKIHDFVEENPHTRPLGPRGQLVPGQNGVFYGTTEGGGLQSEGTVYQTTSAGEVTLLYSFDPLGDGSDGRGPRYGVTAGNDGSFYGTTAAGGGGTNPAGTFFRFTPPSQVTLLYTFRGGADGGSPNGRLALGNDGNLYGTTFAGAGPAAHGTIYRMTPAGVITTLYTFHGFINGDGEIPEGLILGRDGNFYGVTAGGGSSNGGTIYRMSRTGKVTLLYQFGGVATDGNTPIDTLVEGTDGNFYGMTESGGTNGAGTICKAKIFTITSGANATAVVAQHFSYHIAVSNSDSGAPVSYSATGLPQGFVIDAQTGVISGVPPLGSETVSPIFITLNVTNGALTTDGELALTIGDGIPVLTVTDTGLPSGAAPGEQVLSFAAKYPGQLAGRNVFVEANEAGTWHPLATGLDGHMTFDGSKQQYVLNSTSYPLADNVSFRARVTTAGHDAPILSNVVGPFNLASSKQRAGQTAFRIIRNGLRADLDFRATQVATVSGVALRVQSSTTPSDESSWTDLTDASSGHMTQAPDANATRFSLLVNQYPAAQGIYFRAIASASGSVDSLSNLIGPYTLISATPPVITITSPAPSGSDNGQDVDHPILIATDANGVANFNISVSATVASNRSLKNLSILYDGSTRASFKDGNSTATLTYHTDVLGVHVVEAVGVDDLNATGRAGTGPLFVRIAPASASAVKQNQARGRTVAGSASNSGKVFTLAKDGLWTDPAAWTDSQGNSGVPGLNDLAIISSSTVTIDGSITQDIEVGSALINGGHISVPSNSEGILKVDHFLTMSGGSIDRLHLQIPSTATCLMINDVDFLFTGTVSNSGTWLMHGRGGLVGLLFFANTGASEFEMPLIPPAAAGPSLALDGRIISTAALDDSGIIHASLITQDGGSLVSHDGGTLVSHDGGTVITENGAGLVTDGGSGLIGQDGGSLITQDGGSLITQDGGSLIGQDGGSLVGNSGGTFKVGGASSARNSSNVRAATAASGFTQTAGETDLSSVHIIGPVTLNGGILSGSGIIIGNLTNNSGYISPGHSAGFIAVTGNFSQNSGGTLIVEAAGGEANQFDRLQVGGRAILGGKLDLRTINGYIPLAGDPFNPLGYNSASGSFSSVSSNAQTSVNATGIVTTLDPAAPNPSTGQPLNIATRMSVQTGDNVLIAGFIVAGPSGSTKKVLIRGLGPSLAPFGVPNTLSDPLLELHNPDGSVVSNDNWQQGDTSQIPNGFAPSDPREAVIVATLAPGNYSAVVKGAHGETGVGIAELYDLDSASPAKLANISTRGFINTGDDVMIGGFIIGGNEPAKILVRAIGPTLTDFGVQGALADPTLELHDSNGMTIANDDWRETQESEIIATTIPPSKDQEPAILATLAPGNYTAVVRGKNNTTGVGLVEAYNLQ